MEAQYILAVLGLVWVTRWVVKVALDVVAALRKFLWARLTKDNLAVKYGGKWAVVTGCTHGIGKEYARQLAKRGMNILLIARNYDKLDDIQNLIKKESPEVETETVQVDFSFGRMIYPEIARYLADKDVGILVNNVGVITSHPMHFVEVGEDEAWNHINVNMASMVAMTQLVLPGMVARGRGAIINLASVASSQPVPYLGLYSATKVFVDFFSESLRWELRGSGVTVQTIRPGYVTTNMTQYSKFVSEPSTFVPNPERFVASALPTLGHAGRTTGYWAHGLQMFVTDEMFSREGRMFLFDVWNKLLRKEAIKED